MMGEGEGKGFEQRHEHSKKLSLLLDNHLNANEMIYCCLDANEKSFFSVFSCQQICHSLKKIFKWNREENREFIEDSSAFKKIGNKDGKMVFFFFYNNLTKSMPSSLGMIQHPLRNKKSSLHSNTLVRLQVPPLLALVCKVVHVKHLGPNTTWGVLCFLYT